MQPNACKLITFTNGNELIRIAIGVPAELVDSFHFDVHGYLEEALEDYTKDYMLDGYHIVEVQDIFSVIVIPSSKFSYSYSFK